MNEDNDEADLEENNNPRCNIVALSTIVTRRRWSVPTGGGRGSSSESVKWLCSREVKNDT